MYTAVEDRGSPIVSDPQKAEELGLFADLRKKLSQGIATDEEKKKILEILQTTPIDPGWSAFLDFRQKAENIMEIMREESPEVDEIRRAIDTGDNYGLERVEFSPRGGAYSFMTGKEHPYKGFPLADVVTWLDIIKKIGRGFISGMFHSIRNGSKLRLIFLAPAIVALPLITWAAAFAVHRFLGRFRLKHLMYSDFVRELDRVFKTEHAGEKPHDKEYRYMIGNLLCTALEYDNAYRYKLQDVLGELDQKKVEKDFVGEFSRIIKIIQSRETIQDGKDTWSMVLLALKALRFDKRTTRILRYVFSHIDLKKTVLDDSDKCWAKDRIDYKFGFQTEQS